MAAVFMKWLETGHQDYDHGNPLLALGWLSSLIKQSLMALVYSNARKTQLR